MPISGCAPMPLLTPLQRAAFQQPRAGLPSGSSPKMRYAPMSTANAMAPGKRQFPSAGKSSIFQQPLRPADARNNAFTSADAAPPREREAAMLRRPATSPSTRKNPFKAIPNASPTKQSGGRILYGEQDSHRDLTILTCAKDDLDRYASFYRQHLNKAWLEGMADISGRITSLKDQIVHTDPCAQKTLKFRRETNILKALVGSQLIAIKAKYKLSRMEQTHSPKPTAKASGRNPFDGRIRYIYHVGGQPAPAALEKTDEETLAASRQSENEKTLNPIRQMVQEFKDESGNQPTPESPSCRDSSDESPGASGSDSPPPLRRERQRFSAPINPFDGNPIYDKSAPDTGYISQDSTEPSDAGSTSDHSPPISQKKHDISIPREWRAANEKAEAEAEAEPEPISPDWHLRKWGSPPRRMWINPSASLFRSLPIPQDAVRADTPELPNWAAKHFADKRES